MCYCVCVTADVQGTLCLCTAETKAKKCLYTKGITLTQEEQIRHIIQVSSTYYLWWIKIEI